MSNCQEAKPYVAVSINGAKCSALFDTGADSSILAWNWFRRQRFGIKLNNATTQLSTASGESLAVMGTILLPVTIQGKTFVTSFLVVKGIKTNCIIGAKTMKDEKITLNMANRKIIIPGIKPPIGSTVSCCTLLPKSETLVKVHVGQNKGTRLITEDSHLTTERLSINEAVYHICDERLKVVVNNPTDMPIKLSRGTPLVNISPWQPVPEKENSQVINYIGAKKRRKVNLGEIDLSRVPERMKSRYLDLLARNSDLFAENELEVGSADVIQQTISLKDKNKISITPQYRLPHHLLVIAETYIDKLLGAGIIQESVSPFSSPLMLVRKAREIDKVNPLKNYRVVLDYRKLNDNIVPDSYPMRNLNELIDNISGKQIWSVFDLSQGYFNQVLDKQSRQFTAFGLPSKGHFEFTRSPQGLRNSGAAFQRLLDYVTKGIKNVSVYIDDIIVASDTHEEHLEIMQALFHRLRKYRLKLKMNKVQLGAAAINYLGYNISHKLGIRAGEIKTKAIQDWKLPESVKQIKQFLGLCSFFRKTIPHFATIATPLTRLTRKGVYEKGTLPHEAMTAFYTLKKKLSNRPCLRPVDFSKEFIVTVDASTTGLGAILSQRDGMKIESPCAYASRSLNDAERKYSPHHLESLGMVWACRHFKPYLAGREFTLRTDHKPLVSLNRVQGQALERLRAEMEEFLPYKVEYIKGEKMPADGLSRQYELNSLTLTANLSWQQIFKAQTEDLQCKALLCFKKFKQIPQNAHLEKLVSELKTRLKLVKGVVCIEIDKRTVPFAPRNFRSHLLRLAHDSVLSGHFGFEKTLHRLQADWFWPTLRSDVVEYCQSCVTCNRNKNSRKLAMPLRPLPETKEFNERVHIDLMGPLPALQGNKYILVMVDAFSSLIALEAIPEKTADTVAQAFLNGWIKNHGCPMGLNSDQGSEFSNQMFSKLCNTLQIKHLFSSVMHPQSNGKAERQVRNVIEYLRKFLETGENENKWESLLAPMQFAYNSSVHTDKTLSPYLIAFTRRPKLPTTLLSPKELCYTEQEFPQKLHLFSKIASQVISASNESFARNKFQYDKRAKTHNVKVGDFVFITRPHVGKQFQKFQDLRLGPFRVTKICVDVLEILDLDSGKIRRVHKNRVRLASYEESIIDLRGDTQPTTQTTKPDSGIFEPWTGTEENIKTPAIITPRSSINLEWDDMDLPFPSTPEFSSSDGGSSGFLTPTEGSPSPPPLPPRAPTNSPPFSASQRPVLPPRPSTRSTGPVANLPNVQARPIEYKSSTQRPPPNSESSDPNEA